MTGAADFEGLLKQAMGLDAASIGSSAVERAVQARMSVHELADSQVYWSLLTASAGELQALIETVVVPETWFFRDRGAFVTLARFACQDWLPARPGGMLRLLSLPCSSGEEPYSMAMALHEAGFPADRYGVDGVDISTRALAHAGAAVYGKNSFRGVDPAVRQRYFDTTAQGEQLRDFIRQRVRFQQGNLFAPDFLPGAEIYDFIFCRNLLIYFDRATQDRAVGVLQRLLSARGVLFVGPSETGLILSHDFVSAKEPMAFAFHKRGAVPEPAKPVPAPLRMPAVQRASLARPASAAVRPASASPRPAPPPKASLAEASALADQGHLAEAATSCEEHLRRQGPSAQALCLLGLIRAAAGNPEEAVRCYRKALYLDQDHPESLAHLALLLAQQGDADGAQRLRKRLSRVSERSGGHEH
jgi:chemotaxis protein methyltransferase WspC